MHVGQRRPSLLERMSLGAIPLMAGLVLFVLVRHVRRWVVERRAPMMLKLYILYSAVEYVAKGGTPSSRGGRPVQCLRQSFIFELFRRYFDMKIVYEGSRGDLSADGRPVIVAAHPHGVVGIAVLGNLMAENGFFPPTMDYRVLTVSLNFMVPYLRDLFLSLGFVEATPESIRYCLRHNTSVVNVVGGAEEALDSRPGSLDLTLASRSGFIRMAMELGTSIVPMLSFGETDIYDQLITNPPGSSVRRFQEFLKNRFAYSLPLVQVFSPRPVSLTTVVGRPVPIPQIENPTPAQVDHYLQVYIAALTKLYNTFAPKYHAPPLRIVDAPPSKL
ncbi:Acyltransferase [Plasmodiophora brassicae]|uniref:Acyltransferase n=1 Tax=Plasmodiophora brassicae TaxID=37360 RepID=A0A0G4IUV0_PLABS|nr:hypothetical protein PBRA_007136 [Plasmodiophora brassicae]SPQ98578.1 unnamed protein product [Plasmodiophora brassicae]